MALLHQVVELHQPQLAPVLDRVGRVPLTTEDREALRGALADELCASGLNDDDVPNERGLRIEDAIDQLGHL
jgi:hypothetical protein